MSDIDAGYTAYNPIGEQTDKPTIIADSDTVSCPQVQIKYLNYTQQRVYLKDRSGCSFYIEPQPEIGNRKPGFYIQHEYRSSNKCRVFNPLNNNRAGEGVAWSDRVQRVFTRTYCIERHHQPNLAALLCVDLGLIISFTNAVEQLNFPDSDEEAMLMFCKHQARKVETHSLWLSIFIVDNTSKIKPTYWVNIENRIYRIEAIAWPNREDGVYLTKDPDTHSEADGFDYHEGADKGIYYQYKLEDCLYNEKRANLSTAPVLIFENKTEARSLGNMERRTKEHNNELQRQAADLEAQILKSKKELEILKQQSQFKDQEIKNIEQDTTHIKVTGDRIAAKDNIELAQSKSNLEWLKIGGAVVGAVGGLIAGVVALAKLVAKSSSIGAGLLRLCF